jgi:hypothetical protein
MPSGTINRLSQKKYGEAHISCTCIQLYFMESYFGGTLLIVKKYSEFRKE